MSLPKEFTFFGKGDRERKLPDGRIQSSLPQWYFKKHIEVCRQKIDQLTRRIKMGGLDGNALIVAQQQKAQEEEKLSYILSGVPQIKDKEQDHLYDFYKWASGVISDQLFTRSEMQMGLADPAKIDWRNSTKYINISKYRDIAKAANITVIKDKISLTDLTLMWKICGRILDEETNTEWLRKDSRTDVHKQSKSLEQIEKEVKADTGV